jgi:chemotaxis family two-component system response regulator Rcp1
MTKRLHVLLVEDNPADADLTCDTIMTGKIGIDLSIVKDGVEAIEFLRREGGYADADRPDMVLLDLNLPRKDGRQVLACIKDDEALRRIPVVVLTSSDADKDIASSYQLGANCYLTKPGDLHAYRALVRNLESFWLSTARLPPQNGRNPHEGAAHGH